MEIDGTQAPRRQTRRPWPWPVTMGVVLLLMVIGYGTLQGSQWPLPEARALPESPEASTGSPAHPSISITIITNEGVRAVITRLPAGSRARVQFTAFTGPGCAPSALAGFWSLPLDMVEVEGTTRGSASVRLPSPWRAEVDQWSHSWRARVVGDDAYAGTGAPRPFDATSACRSA
jgi:hypothetical protein